MIRTTISLREDLYDQVRLLAAKNRTSLSKIINLKLTASPLMIENKEDIQKKIKEVRALFRRLSANTPPIDSVTAIREMREERINQLTTK